MSETRRPVPSERSGRTAVVHIGIGKTGSTTIQNVLYEARHELLSQERILYPSIAANHSVYLKTVFEEKAASVLPLMDPATSDRKTLARTRRQFRASLEEELARSDWNKVVISAEGLSDFGPEAATELMSWLRRYADDIHIVAYVRHPFDWTRSMIQQRLKTGDTLEQLYASLPGPQWRKRLSPWLNESGVERFHLVSFDDARHGEGILASFCGVAGLPRETVLPFAPTGFVNESMSLEAVMLLDSLNRQRPLLQDGKLSPERRWRGTGVIKSIPGSRFQLAPELSDRIRHKNRPDLEWLNETFGTDLYPDIFEDTLPETPATETMPQATVDALALTLSDYGNRIKRLQDRLSRS